MALLWQDEGHGRRAFFSYKSLHICDSYSGMLPGNARAAVHAATVEQSFNIGFCFEMINRNKKQNISPSYREHRLTEQA
jgi:hypothetical protein